MPKITVIIPVYNQEELVLRAIKSVPKRHDIEITNGVDGVSVTGAKINENNECVNGNDDSCCININSFCLNS